MLLLCTVSLFIIVLYTPTTTNPTAIRLKILGVYPYLKILIKYPTKIVMKFIIFKTPVFLVIVKAPIKSHWPNTNGKPNVNKDMNSYILVAFDYTNG